MRPAEPKTTPMPPIAPPMQQTATTHLRSRLLSDVGVPHAFSTRSGGVSTGIFASLNFGNPGDLPPEQRDPPANIAENFRRLLRDIDASDRRIVEVHQVHGCDVRVVHTAGPDHATPDNRDTKADALVTDDPARIIAVRVADCTPILLSSSDGRVVASVHAGWRGVVGGVLTEAVRAMAGLGVRPADIVAAIGPCIGGGRAPTFEIGPEVVAEFQRAFGQDGATPVLSPIPGPANKALADQQMALRIQLRSAGVPDAQIETLPYCTVQRSDLFFSHRRDQGRTGRMVGLIGPRSR